MTVSKEKIAEVREENENSITTICLYIYKLTLRKTERQKNKETKGQRDRPIDRWTDRQMDRQTETNNRNIRHD